MTTWAAVWATRQERLPHALPPNRDALLRAGLEPLQPVSVCSAARPGDQRRMTTTSHGGELPAGRINSSDPPLTAVGTAYAAPPAPACGRLEDLGSSWSLPLNLRQRRLGATVQWWQAIAVPVAAIVGTLIGAWWQKRATQHAATSELLNSGRVAGEHVTGPGEDTWRRLALLQETDAVKQFLQRAIASINQRDAVDVDPYATLQLLSQGMERLLKLTVIFQYHRAQAKFPNDTDIKQYGHDVERLATTVLATAQADPYFAHRPAAQADIDFATANPTLRLLLHACATFGAPSGATTTSQPLQGRQRRRRTRRTTCGSTSKFQHEAPTMRCSTGSRPSTRTPSSSGERYRRAHHRDHSALHPIRRPHLGLESTQASGQAVQHHPALMADAK